MIEDDIPSAWSGHFPFAYWLVQALNPLLTVELGVDYGASLIALARYNKGYTCGIDWFQGDDQTGQRDTEQIVIDNIRKSGVPFIYVIKSTFDEMAAQWTRGIDLLHIDGHHTYEDVKNDFTKWSPHVRSGGVILFHDTVSFDGPRRVFQEIEWPKFNFTHSAGLGVVTKP